MQVSFRVAGIFGYLCMVVLIADNTHSATLFSACQNNYLNEERPGIEAKLFAPGVVSTSMAEDAGLLFTPDGSELFVRLANYPMGIIYSLKCTDGEWGEPETAPFSGRYWEGRMALAPDGQRLYFSSPMPLSGDGPPKDNDFWYAQKTSTGWSQPVHLGFPLNSADEENDLSVAANGTIYFNREGTGIPFDLYRSRIENGIYQEPELLKIPNHDQYMEAAPMVAPDESFIVFTSSGRPDQTGSFDLYVTFQEPGGSWTEPTNLGDDVNSTFSDKFSTLSPDGKYMFFVSRRPVEANWSKTQRSYAEMLARYASPGNGSTDIYWVSTEVIEQLR